MYWVPVWSLVRKFRFHMLWRVMSIFFFFKWHLLWKNDMHLHQYLWRKNRYTWCTSGSVDQWFNWKRGTDKKGRKSYCLESPVWLSVIFKTAGDMTCYQWEYIVIWDEIWRWNMKQTLSGKDKSKYTLSFCMSWGLKESSCELGQGRYKTGVNHEISLESTGSQII